MHWKDSSSIAAGIDAINKLYAEQRVKTLTNQQRESDERLTSFEDELRRVIIKAESEITMTMSGNERQEMVTNV